MSHVCGPNNARSPADELNTIVRRRSPIVSLPVPLDAEFGRYVIAHSRTATSGTSRRLETAGTSFLNSVAEMPAIEGIAQRASLSLTGRAR